MKAEQDYIRDLTEIRSMMERSTKFLSLTGLSGVMAGIYALIGGFIGYQYFPEEIVVLQSESVSVPASIPNMFFLATVVLVITIATAMILSRRKARQTGEKLWNPVAQRMIFNMLIPLLVGGLLIIILYLKGFVALIAPMTLIFYGLSHLNASKFTFGDFRFLGLAEILLGLAAALFLKYSLVLWIIGFGIVHIIYGIYMHVKYEK